MIKASTHIVGFVAAPVYGLMYARFGHAGVWSIMGISCDMVGKLLFAYIQDFPGKRRYVMLAERCLCGLRLGRKSRNLS